MNKNCTKGFTIIELLLTLSLIVFAGIGIYKTFSNGMKLWEWVSRNKTRMESLFLLSTAEQDLKNMTNFFDGDFHGTAEDMSFCVHNSELLSSYGTETKSSYYGDQPISRVEYIFNDENKQVLRRVFKWGTGGEVLVSNRFDSVEGIEFAFYFLNAEGNFTAMPSWDGNMPCAIGITIKIKNPDDSVNVMKRFIEIPAGY
ncbi:MAG: hypothetical protein HQL28_01690 [Candidatus Omnitrophica bacterium]|nr:hypothetical protein [Candidatus Omnitrophota bacterium]